MLSPLIRKQTDWVSGRESPAGLHPAGHFPAARFAVTSIVIPLSCSSAERRLLKNCSQLAPDRAPNRSPGMDSNWTALLDLSDDFIARFDRSLRHLYINRAYLGAVGLTANAVIGRTNEELGMPADRCRFWREQQMEVFASGEVRIFEFQFLMPDGIVHSFVAKCAPETRRGDQIETIVCFVRDTTLSKRLEAETRALRRDLAHLIRGSTMGVFGRGVAHELNQPLTAIRCNAETGLHVLTQPEPDLGLVGDILQDIVSANQRASEIIRRMGEMLVRGRAASRRTDLNLLVSEMPAFLPDEALGNGVSISLELAPKLPLVRGDRIQLQQVFLNLMMNAVEAMQGPPTRMRRLVLRTLHVDAETVQAEVEDTGRGIAPADLERIFEPFHTSKPEGTGLGLWISRAIVAAHGGKLRVENNAAGGATFVLILPVAPVASV